MELKKKLKIEQKNRNLCTIWIIYYNLFCITMRKNLNGYVLNGGLRQMETKRFCLDEQFMHF